MPMRKKYRDHALVRRRSRLALTLAEREEISRGLVVGRSHSRYLMLAKVSNRETSSSSHQYGCGCPLTSPRLATCAVNLATVTVGVRGWACRVIWRRRTS
jgi:hypothetical protein